MILEFEKPLTPNYIRTKQGLFAVGQLTYEELIQYIELWDKELMAKWNKRRADK